MTRRPGNRLFAVVEAWPQAVQEVGPERLSRVAERGGLRVDLGLGSGGLFIVLDSMAVGEGDDGAGDDAGVRHDAGGHDPSAVRDLIDRQFEEPEGEVQAGVGLKVLGDGLDAFADAVSDEEEQEAPAAQVGGQGVVELHLVDGGVGRADDVQQGRGATLENLGDLALEVGDGEAGQFLGVVQNLADDLAAGLGVAPELALDKHRQAGGRDQEVVDEAGRRLQFAADRYGAFEDRVDLGDGQDGRVLVDEGLDVVLQDAAGAGLGEGDQCQSRA